ncbi:MAG: MJ0042-type zinc finger domain-containing protein [Candidatus Bathyarchaeia archaeon]
MMKKLLGYVSSAVLLIFGVIFALASVYAPTRLVVSAFLFLTGFGILYYIRKQQPIQITQKLEVPGQIKVQMLKCPNCSAALDVNQIKIVKGVPSIRCSYCGHTFEVTEEPKW